MRKLTGDDDDGGAVAHPWQTRSLREVHSRTPRRDMEPGLILYQP